MGMKKKKSSRLGCGWCCYFNPNPTSTSKHSALPRGLCFDPVLPDLFVQPRLQLKVMSLDAQDF